MYDGLNATSTDSTQKVPFTYSEVDQDENRHDLISGINVKLDFHIIQTDGVVVHIFSSCSMAQSIASLQQQLVLVILFVCTFTEPQLSSAFHLRTQHALSPSLVPHPKSFLHDGIKLSPDRAHAAALLPRLYRSGSSSGSRGDRFAASASEAGVEAEISDAYCVLRYKWSREFALSVVAFTVLDMLLLFTRGGGALAPSTSLAASLSSLSLMSVAAISSDVLHDAGRRGRLSASTFQKLNLGMLLGAVPLLFNEGCHCARSAMRVVMGLLAAGGTLPASATALPLLLSEVVVPLWSVLFASRAISGSYRALQQHGLPKLQVHLGDPLQKTYAVSSFLRTFFFSLL